MLLFIIFNSYEIHLLNNSTMIELNERTFVLLHICKTDFFHVIFQLLMRIIAFPYLHIRIPISSFLTKIFRIKYVYTKHKKYVSILNNCIPHHPKFRIILFGD